jgi:hypothetical protein
VTRKLHFLGIAVIAVVVGTVAAMAQSPYRAPQPDPQTASKGMAAIQHAAAAEKYLFVFFWKEQGRQTDAMWSVFQSAMSKVADRAESVAVNVSDPVEKPIVARFGVDRAPMPLVLALAPNGAITKGLAGKFNEDQLSQAFVSPGTANALKGLQARKLVLLSIQSRSPYVRQVSPQQGVTDFAADPRFAGATEIVSLDPADPAEASFLQELQVDPRSGTSVIVLLAPPGSVVGKFEGSATKEQIAARLASAQSSCCPGGKCGPGGCCPK